MNRTSLNGYVNVLWGGGGGWRLTRNGHHSMGGSAWGAESCGWTSWVDRDRQLGDLSYGAKQFHRNSLEHL